MSKKQTRRFQFRKKAKKQQKNVQRRNHLSRRNNLQVEAAVLVSTTWLQPEMTQRKWRNNNNNNNNNNNYINNNKNNKGRLPKNVVKSLFFSNLPRPPLFGKRPEFLLHFWQPSLTITITITSTIMIINNQFNHYVCSCRTRRIPPCN